MPEISRFCGIIIRMFVEAAGEHHRPHFHAYSEDEIAIVAVDTVELEDWDLLQSGQPPAKIAPLQ